MHSQELAIYCFLFVKYRFPLNNQTVLVLAYGAMSICGVVLDKHVHAKNLYRYKA